MSQSPNFSSHKQILGYRVRSIMAVGFLILVTYHVSIWLHNSYKSDAVCVAPKHNKWRVAKYVIELDVTSSRPECVQP